MSFAKQDAQLQNYQDEENKKAIYRQDKDLTKFLDSLPKQKGWHVPYSYQLHGFWLIPRAVEGIVSCQDHFQAQDSDILLATLPKCGTTWLKSLVFTILNRNKHSPLSPEHPLVTKNPHDLVLYLELFLYGANKVPDLSSFTTPRLFATHSPLGLLPKSIFESNCKLVYTCRNPKDAFISLWHFLKSIMVENYALISIEEAVDMFCKGVNPSGPFWDHMLEYWKASLENPEKVFFLTYEELQNEPIHVVRRLADFLGYSFSAEEENSGMVETIVKLCSFESLSKMKVNENGKVSISGLDCKSFFRKGEVGDWKNHLTNEMGDRMDAVVQEKLQGSGLLELKTATFPNQEIKCDNCD